MFFYFHFQQTNIMGWIVSPYKFIRFYPYCNVCCILSWHFLIWYSCSAATPLRQLSTHTAFFHGSYPGWSPQILKPEKLLDSVDNHVHGPCAVALRLLVWIIPTLPGNSQFLTSLPYRNHTLCRNQVNVGFYWIVLSCSSVQVQTWGRI